MNDNIKEQVKYKMAMLKLRDDVKIEGNKQKNILNKEIGIAACIVLTASGVAVATNFENIKEYIKLGRGLGNGIDTAVEEGYIQQNNGDVVNSEILVEKENTILENINSDVAINSFLMDDYNLSMDYTFDFDEKIKESIDLKKVKNVIIRDLIIRDDENNIIYKGMENESFKKYCEENNFEYNSYDKSANCGINSFIYNIDDNNCQICLMYNLYTDNFPKSKQLFMQFSKLDLEVGDEEITIIGDWKIDLDVPEIMYNRSKEYYKVIKCTDDNFDVYAANVSDTGFEIGIIIKNIQKPIDELEIETNKLKEELLKKRGINENSTEEEIKIAKKEMLDEFNKIINESEYYRNLYTKHYAMNVPIDISGTYDLSMRRLAGEYVDIYDESNTKSYVENSNGDKFYCTMSPSRKQINRFLEGDKYEFYETFDMTKATCTDEIKVILYYYGKEVEIKLKKI